jgi:hypothetical protein
MTKVLQGTINGRTIELTEDIGFAPGAKVEVHVRTLPERQNWGEGIKRCAGALADDPEWDAIMEEIHRGRKLERRASAEDE